MEAPRFEHDILQAGEELAAVQWTEGEPLERSPAFDVRAEWRAEQVMDAREEPRAPGYPPMPRICAALTARARAREWHAEEEEDN